MHCHTNNAVRRAASSRLKIVVLGYVVRGPIGGMAWHHLQYVLGLHRLGHQVVFLEDSDDYASCYDPSAHQMSTDASYGLRFAAHSFSRLGLEEEWAYYDAHTDRWLGPAAARAVTFCGNADVLINISGVNRIRSWHENVPLLVLVDTDPVFTHVRHLKNESARRQAGKHHVFFSFGELIASGKSNVPDDGFPWQPTRQPVVLDAWPVTKPPVGGCYTTVMQWDSYPSVEFRNRRFGMKSASFEMIRELPNRSSVQFEVALGGAEAPRRKLESCGWRLVDPLTVTRDPWTYQQYLQQSRGELSVAKQGYVISHCGWFSERTACYLACGRPAVVQDTGFSQLLPCGRGIWAFQDADSALEGICSIESNYDRHCLAARELAAEFFDSSKVLESLISRAIEYAG